MAQGCTLFRLQGTSRNELRSRCSISQGHRYVDSAVDWQRAIPETSCSSRHVGCFRAHRPASVYREIFVAASRSGFLGCVGFCGHERDIPNGATGIDIRGSLHGCALCPPVSINLTLPVPLPPFHGLSFEYEDSLAVGPGCFVYNFLILRAMRSLSADNESSHRGISSNGLP